MISWAAPSSCWLEATAHLSDDRVERVLHEGPGEVDNPQKCEVCEVIFKGSEVDSVGVQVGQDPVDLEEEDMAKKEVSNLLGDQSDLLRLVEDIPEYFFATSQHYVASSRVTQLGRKTFWRKNKIN